MAKSDGEDALLAAARSWLPTYQVLVHRTDMGEWAKPEAHHKEMIAVMADESLPDVAIVEPRDAAKTTLAQSYIEWTIGRASLAGGKDWANQLRILYLRHAEDKAGEVSDAIRHTIRYNPVYQKLFPGVKPNLEKWSQSVWRVEGSTDKDPTFTCGGINAPPLGGRYSLIIADDIADDNNMATPGERDKIRRKLNRTVMPMRVPTGRMILLGTRWHHEDVVAWAEDRGFHMLVRKALEQDEEGNWVSYWPARYPVPYLLNLKEKDPRGFALQYQNETTPEEGLTFERWWFQKRFDALPADVAFRYESWDLASTTGRKSDHTVGLAFIVTPECPLCNGAPWHAFLPHMFRGKIPYGYVKKAIRDCYQQMGGYSANHWITIEKKNVGEAIAGEGLHEQGRGEMYPIHFRSASGEGRSAGMKDKDIYDVTQICFQGRVHLPSDEFIKRSTRQADWLIELEQELFGYDHAAPHTPDVVSALVQGVLEMEEKRFDFQRRIQGPPVQYALPRANRVQV